MKRLRAALFVVTDAALSLLELLGYCALVVVVIGWMLSGGDIEPDA